MRPAPVISISYHPPPFPLPSREGDLKPSPLAGEGRERGHLRPQIWRQVSAYGGAGESPRTRSGVQTSARFRWQFLDSCFRRNDECKKRVLPHRSLFHSPAGSHHMLENHLHGAIRRTLFQRLERGMIVFQSEFMSNQFAEGNLLRRGQSKRYIESVHYSLFARILP